MYFELRWTSGIHSILLTLFMCVRLRARMCTCFYSSLFHVHRHISWSNYVVVCSSNSFIILLHNFLLRSTGNLLLETVRRISAQDVKSVHVNYSELFVIRVRWMWFACSLLIHLIWCLLAPVSFAYRSATCVCILFAIVLNGVYTDVLEL